MIAFSERISANAEENNSKGTAMTRAAAIAAAEAYFEEGGFVADLARRVAIPTESQVEERLPVLRAYLADEIAPSLNSWWSWWIGGSNGAGDWPARLRELFDGADRLLAEGPHLRERLIELGCPPEKVAVQRIAIPVSDLAFRARTRPGARPVLMFAGRFCEQKGVLEALEEQVVLLTLLGEATSDAVTVRIGQENPFKELQTTSVVASGYGSRATLGVVGPTRMDYPSTMASVRAVARYVGRFLAQ